MLLSLGIAAMRSYFTGKLAAKIAKLWVNIIHAYTLAKSACADYREFLIASICKFRFFAEDFIH